MPPQKPKHLSLFEQSFGVSPKQTGPTLEASKGSGNITTSPTPTPTNKQGEGSNLANLFNPREDIARSEGFAAAKKEAGTFLPDNVSRETPGTTSAPKPMTLQEKEAEARKTGRPFRTNEFGEIRFQDTGEVFDPTQSPAPGAGTEGTDSALNALYDAYGIEPGSKEAKGIEALTSLFLPDKAQKADTSELDKKISEKGAKLDRSEQIRENLQKSLDATKQKYALEREQAERDVENARKQRTSALSKMGVSNPLSSGFSSIGTASAEFLDRKIRNIDAQEALENSILRKEAFDQETTADREALDFLKEERNRIEDEARQDFEDMRTRMQDRMDAINFARGIIESGQKASIDAISRAQGAVYDMLGEFGSAAFDGMDDEALDAYGKSIGLPGSLSAGIRAIKQKELDAARFDKKLNLRTIDGSLYNITYDEEGNVKPELVIKGKKGFGGSKKAGTYFTRPDPETGDIEYLFGDKNKPEEAQQITSEQYLKGKSSAEGVLTEEPGAEDFKTDVQSMLDEGFNKDEAINEITGNKGEDDLLPSEKKIIDEVYKNKTYFGNKPGLG